MVTEDTVEKVALALLTNRHCYTQERAEALRSRNDTIWRAACDDARAAINAMSDVREAVKRAWEQVREDLNREHREGIISYRELKFGLNNAAFIRDAALESLSGGGGGGE